MILIKLKIKFLPPTVEGVGAAMPIIGDVFKRFFDLQYSFASEINLKIIYIANRIGTTLSFI